MSKLLKMQGKKAANLLIENQLLRLVSAAQTVLASAPSTPPGAPLPRRWRGVSVTPFTILAMSGVQK